MKILRATKLVTVRYLAEVEIKDDEADEIREATEEGINHVIEGMGGWHEADDWAEIQDVAIDDG